MAFSFCTVGKLQIYMYAKIADIRSLYRLNAIVNQFFQDDVT